MTTTTMPERYTEFEAVLRLVDPVTIGSLQIVFDYSQTSGDFRGSGPTKDDGGTLGRAIDQNGEILDALVQAKRDKRAGSPRPAELPARRVDLARSPT